MTTPNPTPDGSTTPATAKGDDLLNEAIRRLEEKEWTVCWMGRDELLPRLRELRDLRQVQDNPQGYGKDRRYLKEHCYCKRIPDRKCASSCPCGNPKMSGICFRCAFYSEASINAKIAEATREACAKWCEDKAAKETIAIRDVTMRALAVEIRALPTSPATPPKKLVEIPDETPQPVSAYIYQETLKPAPREQPFKVGDRVRTFDENQLATVMEVGDGGCLIHHDEFSIYHDARVRFDLLEKVATPRDQIVAAARPVHAQNAHGSPLCGEKQDANTLFGKPEELTCRACLLRGLDRVIPAVEMPKCPRCKKSDRVNVLNNGYGCERCSEWFGTPRRCEFCEKSANEIAELSRVKGELEKANAMHQEAFTAAIRHQETISDLRSKLTSAEQTIADQKRQLKEIRDAIDLSGDIRMSTVELIKEKWEQLREYDIETDKLSVRIASLESELVRVKDELEKARKKQEVRDGNWIDEWGCCKICDGEIPHGHSKNCDLYKREMEIADWKNPKFTTCFPCGKLVSRDDFLDHIKTCEKHPLSVALSRLKELETPVVHMNDNNDSENNLCGVIDSNVVLDANKVTCVDCLHKINSNANGLIEELCTKLGDAENTIASKFVFPAGPTFAATKPERVYYMDKDRALWIGDNDKSLQLGGDPDNAVRTLAYVTESYGPLVRYGPLVPVDPSPLPEGVR